MPDKQTAEPKEVGRQTMRLSAPVGATHVRLEVSGHTGPGWWEKLDAVTLPLDGETRLEIIFLQDPPAQEPAGATAPADTRIVTAAAGLNVRAGPSSDNELLATLPLGTVVRVLEEFGPWARVRAGKRIGFVSSEFLTDADPEDAPAQAVQESSEVSADFRFLAWPTVERRVNQHFGENPQLYERFGLPGHEGIDLRSPIDTPYFCVAPGEVIWVSDRRRSSDEKSAYGWHVIIDHGNGYSTLYAHARPDVPVKSGDRLEAGDVVAFSGNTGNSSGPHLHLTLKKTGFQHPEPDWPPGYMDPWPFLQDLPD